MSSDQFSAIPGKNDPKTLSFRYQWRLVESIKVYLAKIAQSLQIPLASQLKIIEMLDPHLRFSPEIFSIYVRLRDAYPQKDLHGIFDALQSIKNLSSHHFYCLERRYETILTEGWETPFVAEMRARHPLDEGGDPLTLPIRMLPLVHWKEQDYPPKELLEAEGLICELDEDLWKEFQTYVTRIKLFSGRVLEGVTSPRFFGNIYLRLPHPDEDSLLFYFEHLIHEASHLHLFAMMGEDPLVLNPDSERFSSPLRADKRPMSGIFHATFVIARIIRAFKKLTICYPENTKALAVLKHFEPLLFEGLATVDKHAKLTSNGRQIFLSMEPCALE
jgi:hypothetical protein